MKKLIKMTAILSILIVLAVFGVNMLSFAYFTANNKEINSDKYGTDLEDKNVSDKVVKVSTAREFKKAVTDSTYNNSSDISAIKDRKTVLLMGNIELSNNVTISADVNIDLNNKRIDLNGFDITLKHSYHGNVLIYNGDLLSDGQESRVIFNTPNAVVDMTNVTLTNVVTENIAVDRDKLFELVFASVPNKLASELSSKNYYSGTRELSRNRHCPYHRVPTSNNNCTYISGDIDMDTNYYGYDVAISYTSSNEDILSNNGRVDVNNVSTVESVTLTANAIIGSETRSVSYNIHVYNSSDRASVDKISLVMLGEYFERFYREYLTPEGTAVIQEYQISSSTIIPKFNFNDSVIYAYETRGADGTVLDSTSDIKGINFNLDKNSGGVDYVLNLDNNVATLRIMIAGGEYIDLAVSGEDVSAVKDNYTIALGIARQLYGKEIVIKKDDNGHNGYTKHSISRDMSAYAKDNVTSVDYQLSYDIDKVYRLGELSGGEYLYVVGSDNPPTILQKAAFKMRFYFSNEPKQVTINIPIRFDDEHIGDGDYIAKFWPYYNYFDRLFQLYSGGYTYQSFSMPFGYETDGPVYYLEVLRADGTPEIAMVNQVLAYTKDGAEVIIELADVINLNSSEIANIMLSGNAKWRITFNVNASATTNTVLNFRYRYKFSNYGGAWLGAEEPFYMSSMIAPGLITPARMTDVNLYAYIYNNSKPRVFTEPYREKSNMFILSDWLEKEFVNEKGVSEINNENNALVGMVGMKGITSYVGIEYVKHVKVLNVKNASLGVDSIENISQMTGLEELNIANNGTKMYDRGTGIANFPTSAKSNILLKLQKLPNLAKLHLEGNHIYYFSELTGMKALKEVCVFGNNFEHKIWTIVVATNIYGTNGIVNYSTFATLVNRGVIVRNGNENDGYRDNGMTNKIIKAMNSISYNRIIGVGESIENAYSGLSTNIAEYGLTKSSTYTGKDDLIEFLYNGDKYVADAFTMRYTYYAGNWLFGEAEVSIDVEFTVIRV